ncbi:MAG: SDR family oxidoreductase [Ktedonobacterales bacterium]
MILVVGARGRLGNAVARQLLAQGQAVRAMSRTPEALNDLRQLGAEVVAGDLRNPQALALACAGVDGVLAAAHAFDGHGDNVPQTVDHLGSRSLIDAACAAGVGHFVFTSIHGARHDHPIDLFRYKSLSEDYLRASGLNYTILRPTAFMELWAMIIGEPMLKQGKAMIFGRGVNPINFVAAGDVAGFATLAFETPQARNRIIEIGGPANLTFEQVVAIFERVTGRTVGKQHIPLPAMRALRLLMRPINPAFSRQISTGILMDTQDMTFDPAETLTQFPMRLTPMEEVAQRWYKQHSTDHPAS